MTTMISTTLHDPRVQPLLDGLATLYRSDYGESVAGDIELYGAAEFARPTGALLLLVAEERALAGGALRRWGDGVGEIKRMWTDPAYRQQGHGRRILTALERAARELGYRSVRLETGARQAAAIELYRSAGYRRMPAYGRWAAHPLCVCFEKPLPA